MLEKADSDPEEGDDRDGVDHVGDAGDASASDVGEAARGDSNTQRSAEDAGTQVGYAVCAEFFITIGRPERSVSSAEMFDYAGRDEQVDRCHES